MGLGWGWGSGQHRRAHQTLCLLHLLRALRPLAAAAATAAAAAATITAAAAAAAAAAAERASHVGVHLPELLLQRRRLGLRLRRKPVRPLLNGQRRENRRLWRRLAQALKAVTGGPGDRSLPWERRASQSRQARPEEAQEPTSGTAKGGTLTLLPHLGHADALFRLSPRSRRAVPRGAGLDLRRTVVKDSGEGQW